MKKFKDFLKEFFIDGLSGMATGLFATLIIGTIVLQIGTVIPGEVGRYVTLVGKVAQMLTGAGIGCGVAIKLKAQPLTIVSAAVSGMVGAFAKQIILGTILVEGLMTLPGPGEPLGAFLAAIAAVYLGKAVAGKTKLDILVTPLALVTAGSAVGLILGMPIDKLMTVVRWAIKTGTEQAPFLMGIIVSVLMGIALTLPISSAAIGVILQLSGIGAGAATVGCCANMVGFAVASFKDNKWNGLFAQGIGTSMLQMPNIVKKPIIWLPAIIASAILGPLSTVVFHFENNATGSGMGTAGLVGPINAFQVMTANGTPAWLVLVEIVLLCFILPGVISWLVAFIMRKMGLIKDGDMKLN